VEQSLALGFPSPYSHAMDFDDQLRRHFGTADLDTLTPDAISAGIERMRVEFGLEKDRNRRFALWTLLHMLGAAPDLDVAFADEEDREAARDFMDMIDAADEG
jgi:hypothetical protein